jgi:hypothetical protein
VHLNTLAYEENEVLWKRNLFRRERENLLDGFLEQLPRYPLYGDVIDDVIGISAKKMRKYFRQN